MWNYGLTEEKLRSIQEELAKRKGKVKIQSSAYLSGKLVSLLKNKSMNTAIDTELNQKNHIELKMSFAVLKSKILGNLDISQK